MIEPDRRVRVLVLTSGLPLEWGDSTSPFVWELARRLSATHAVTVLAPGSDGVAGASAGVAAEWWDEVEVWRFRYFWPMRWQRLRSPIMETLRQRPLLWGLVPFLVAAELVAT